MLIKNFNTKYSKDMLVLFPFYELYLTMLSIGQLKYRWQVNEK